MTTMTHNLSHKYLKINFLRVATSVFIIKLLLLITLFWYLIDHYTMRKHALCFDGIKYIHRLIIEDLQDEFK